MNVTYYLFLHLETHSFCASDSLDLLTCGIIYHTGLSEY